MPVMDLLLLTLALAVPVGWGQLDDVSREKFKYYLDSNSDCNGPRKEIYGQRVTVAGHGASQEQQGPTSCALTLKSVSNFDHTNLLLQVTAASINDCDVQLVIYDGDPGQGTLKGYDCHSSNKMNERNFVTTGDVVSFVLERKNVINTLYDIEIVIVPLVSGNKPGYENDYGDSWGYFREKLENDIAIGIVGAAFLLVIILVAIIVFICYRRYMGKNKPWEQHQLSTFRPPQSIYETKSKMSDTSSGMWMSNMSRGPAADPPRRRVEPNRRMERPSEDDDSVFDDASDIAPKKYLVDEDRRWERRRERERERERQRGRGRERGSQNSSYVQADDDHPQDTYVERIIEPRTRSRRIHKPPSYNEAINESDTEKSDTDEEDDDDDIHKRETSEEESEEASSEPEEEEEDDEEEEDGDVAARKPAARPKPRPHQQHPHPGPVPPGMQPGHPAYPGYPHPTMGYVGGYPMGPGGGQFVPLVAAGPPAPGQPFPTMAGPGHPPPQYPGQRGPPPAAPAVRPTEPPIYSYLVQRGYTPLEPGQEGLSSSHNTSRSQGSGLDEPDRRNLASGVEYLSR